MPDRNRMLDEIKELVIRYSLKFHVSKIFTDYGENHYAENNIRDLLNSLMGWNLVNANEIKANAPGVDLIEQEKKICIQVTSTVAAKKISHTLDKCGETCPNGGWKLKMFLLTMDDADVEKLRKKSDLNNPAFAFDVESDIWSFSWLLKQADSLENTALEKFYSYCNQVFGSVLPAPGIPFLLTNPPAAVDEAHFLCREKDEAEVIRLLREKRHLLLMNGVGGIGKSTLARKVFHRIKGEYAHAAWVTCRGKLADDLLADFSIFRQEYEDEQSRELRLRKILDFLKQPGKKLLVEDNANQYDPMLRILSGFGDTLDILVTSRMQELSSYEPYHLEYLSKEACRSVFYCYCEALTEGEEQETVDKLIGLVQYHTLGTELLAKSLGFGDDPKEFYQNLVDKGFGFPDLRVEGDYLRDRGEETAKTMAEHLKILFDLQERSPEEVRILQNLALMPTMPIPVQVKAWIKADPNALQSLVKSGWLDYDKDSKTYYLHPILRETVLLDEIPGSIGTEFFDCLHRKEFIKDDETWDKALPKLDIAAAVLEGYTGGENRIFVLAGNALAALYWKRGLYSKTIPILEHCIQIEQAAAEPDQKWLATFYNNISSIYWSMGRLEEALEYSEKALEIKKKVLGEKHPDLAQSYNNIANIFHSMGRLEEALEYSKKAVEIAEKVLGADHPNLATSYNNISSIYWNMGRLEEALEYSEKALAIREKVLGADHPNLATSYNNIATIYFSLGRLEDALEYSEKALAIMEKVLGKNHPNTAVAYGNIASIYAAMGNKEKAAEYRMKEKLAKEGKLPG